MDLDTLLARARRGALEDLLARAAPVWPEPWHRIPGYAPDGYRIRLSGQELLALQWLLVEATALRNSALVELRKLTRGRFPSDPLGQVAALRQHGLVGFRRISGSGDGDVVLAAPIARDVEGAIRPALAAPSKGYGRPTAAQFELLSQALDPSQIAKRRYPRPR
jgi:hypothetical protein